MLIGSITAHTLFETYLTQSVVIFPVSEAKGNLQNVSMSHIQ